MKNNYIVGIIVAIIVLGGVVGALAFYMKKPAPTEERTSADAANTTEASQMTTVTYTDDGFSPRSYTVKANGTVTVVNNSSRDLEFSSDNHPTHTEEPELNMNVLHPGDSGDFKVTRTGTWGFHNHLRAEDTGTLIVQ